MRTMISIKCIICVCLIIILINSCGKSETTSPLYSYTMDCSETANDTFVGNVTTFSSSTILAHNREEAEHIVAKSNYRFGNESKNCRLK